MQFEEFGAGPGKLAAVPVAVKAEVGHSAHEQVSGFDQGDGVVNLIKRAGDGEEVGFHRGNTIDAPGKIGKRADEVEFIDRSRLEAMEEGLEVYLIELGILAGDDGLVAGEPVAESVQGRGLFAFRGPGAGGSLSVQTVA